MKRGSILLVEDDDDVRILIKTFLENKYNIHEATSSLEAMNCLINPVDLAIIDYLLPDCNGLELLEKIRKVRPFLPAIIMTAYSSESLVIKALRAGVTDYIKKPLSLNYLALKISNILGQDTETPEVNDVILSKEEFIMDAIGSYIDERYMEHDLTFNKIVELSRMSKSRFCNAFKKRFGMTFTDYLNRIRIRNAMDILKNPDLNISEVAHFVGFGSLVHFERVFKEIQGISPREYRKKFRK